MQNGQGSGGTETGAYTLVGGQTSGSAPARTAGATFSIPTENEWYKAAYYDASKGEGGGYWAYATQSDTAPGNIIGGSSNQANYYTGAGYSVTQSTSYSSSQPYLTDVGAFIGSSSFYGTFDQSGNVFQWNDLSGSSASFRGARGGSWDYGDALVSFLSSSGRHFEMPLHAEESNVGFRLAFSNVPEIDPAGMRSVLALVTGVLSLVERRRLKLA